VQFSKFTQNCLTIPKDTTVSFKYDKVDVAK